MKFIGLQALLLLVLVFSGCLLRQRQEIPLPGFPEEPAAEGRIPVFKPMPRILDYEGKAAGGEIPEWVSRYFTEAGAGVERMAEYRGKYVFIGENLGANLSALIQWQAAFSPIQDFAQLAAARIEARLAKGAAGSYPDNVYGPFFEAAVKKAYDTKYQGIQKEKGFWVRLVPPEIPPAAPGEEETGLETEEAAERPAYVFLILLSAGRPDFEAQVEGILNSAKADLSLTRSQEAAVNRVRESFFNESF
ncbi:MAG: hypothetical protein LBR93_10660 [Treponema sp.]|jgi:hypothetical protein|nr:hypothetical protein [Treponema sp.]